MFFYAVIPVLLMIFGGVNYYIGLRTWQWLGAIAPAAIPRPAYWIAFWLLALTFLLARMAPGWVPLWVTEVMAQVGGYWLALFVYILPLLILFDIARLLNRVFKWVPTGSNTGASLIKLAGAAACLLFVGLMVYGTWRARTPVVTDYALSIPKSAGAYQELNVVLISDTHLGTMIGNGRIRQLVTMVNRLEPDLILLAGDIIDDDFRPFIARNMAAELGQMRAPLGTYGVLGNHDVGAENLAPFREEMARAGLLLLVDEWVKVDDSFYIIGRNDSSYHRRGGGLPLDDVLAGVDTSLPILLMDHQPNRLDEAVAAGVDLQVSGHTHRGQMWPGSLITERIFAVDWGYLRQGATQFVVSLGWGTWGPPMRIGNRPEVVRIHLSFGE